MGNRLYVGNLAFQTTETEIQDAFSQVGTVTEVKLVLDRETGRSRGFAFVSMGSDAEAQKAIAELNGRNLDGRDLRVNEAEERRARRRRRRRWSRRSAAAAAAATAAAAAAVAATAAAVAAVAGYGGGGGGGRNRR